MFHISFKIKNRKLVMIIIRNEVHIKITWWFQGFFLEKVHYQIHVHEMSSRAPSCDEKQSIIMKNYICTSGSCKVQ